MHCLRPSCNYAPPGVIHGPKKKEKSPGSGNMGSAMSAELISWSGSSTLWLAGEFFFRLSFDITRVLTSFLVRFFFFLSNQLLLLGHRAQIGQGTFERRKFLDGGEEGEKSNSFVLGEKVGQTVGGWWQEIAAPMAGDLTPLPRLWYSQCRAG